ncbi:MAG TPA: TonB-dependent receptor [Caulobacterales bacterium]|nr:TonB-dependent receptor [Caulobacterales bacterium]
MKHPPISASRRIRRTAGVFLGVSGVLIGAPSLARADDVDPFALSPEQLFDAKVISATRTSEPLWNSPAAIFVISNEDIVRSGVTSIPEALRLAPGVEVARINSSSWAVSIRGFNAALANKLLVLIDGREVYDPLFSGVYWDVQDVAIEDIDRIEIVRGPGASLWGANAVNGVINIITKSAADTQGALVSVAGGNVDQALVTARYGGGRAGMHWRIYGRYFDRASYDTLSMGDANSAWEQRRGGFRIDFDRTHDTLTLQGDIYDSDSGELRAVPLLVAPYAEIAREHISAQGANVLGRWTHAFADTSSFSAQAYVDYTARNQIPLDDKRTTFDLDTQYDFPRTDHHALVAGLRYRYTRDALEATPIIFSDRTSNSEELYSGFVQDRITLQPERWVLTLGSKFDHNDFTGFEIQPNVRLQWMDGETQSVWAAASRAVRTPSELERDLTVVAGVIPPGMLPLPVSVQPTASPDFESEELIAYELGYRRRWSDSISTDLAAFYNRYEGLATLSLAAPTLDGPPLHVVLPIAYTNLTDGYAQGFEATLDWRLAPGFMMSANYSLLDIELDGPPSSAAIDAEAAEDTAPRNLAGLRAQWDVNELWSLDAMLYYTDNLRAFRIPASTRLDLRAGWRMTDTIELELIGQNVLDDSRPEFGDAAGPATVAIDRSLLVRLTWRQ